MDLYMVNKVAVYTLIFALVLGCFQLVIDFQDSLLYGAAISLLWYLTHSWGRTTGFITFIRAFF